MFYILSIFSLNINIHIEQFCKIICFYRIMTGSVSVNQNMKNPPLNVGVINPPDKFYKPVLYSPVQAERELGAINKDVYVSIQNSESITKKKTPKSVFVALGLGTLAICFPMLKKLIKR